MAVAIRLLPLLVVGCMVLQALTVSGEAVCEQTDEGEKLIFEEYAREFGRFTKKASGKPRSKVGFYVVTPCSCIMSINYFVSRERSKRMIV